MQRGHTAPTAGQFLLIILVFMLSVLAGSQSVFAQLSPGDLSQAHAKLEGLDNCRACHGTDRKQIAPNCLTCHTIVKQQLDTGVGLHGRNIYNTCEDCHVEHHGRDFKLVYWKDGDSAFDHSLTGYNLTGAHKPLQCRNCHNAKNVPAGFSEGDSPKDPARTFQGLSTACNSCHFDEHRGQLGSKCESCHTNSAWKPAASFDHQKAKYPLAGQHLQVACAKCHPSLSDAQSAADTSYTKFTGITFSQCSSCHRDPHANRLGPNCTGCHNVNGWRSVDNSGFDHSRTRFPLLGLHKPLACAKCHKQEEPRKALAFSVCSDCHADFHQGAFAKSPGGAKCERCHNVDGFRPGIFTVEQHDSSSYPLQGAHLAVPCDGCHISSPVGKSPRQYRFKFEQTACKTCHRDPHNGKADQWIAAGGCESCHSVQSWSESTFAHDSTKFPLRGKHAQVKCLACHGNKNDKTNVSLLTFALLPSNCNDCHIDIHRGQFVVAGATACDRCHSTDNWKASKFVHDRDSRYKLEGAHARVSCGECHKNVIEDSSVLVRYKPISTDCNSCHKNKTGDL